MDEDSKFLKETLRLGKKGMGWTNPNPMVGAVIVKKGQIVGKGYHKKLGFPHAEIEALEDCKESPKGATLYVNLEPCIHFGRTPPCVDAMIKASIKKVVCCGLDPNPKVSSMGIAALKKAEIEVSVGTLKDQARSLNEAFFTFHEKKRPFIAIKFAASLDGKIATKTGDSKWITNEKARIYARKLRGQYQAVMVGINTVLKDNPHLGARIKGRKDPMRIILDSKLQISLSADVLRDTNVIIATTKNASKIKKKQLENKGISVLTFEDDFIKIPELMSKLREKEIISILVEGGGETLGNLVDARLIDKVYAFHAPIVIGGKNAVTIGGEGVQTIQNALHLKNISYKKFDDNLLTIGYTV